MGQAHKGISCQVLSSK